MKNKSEILSLYIIIIVLLLIILSIRPDDKDILSVVRAGNTQILSTIDKNSCFHLEFPAGSLTKDGN